MILGSRSNSSTMSYNNIQLISAINIFLFRFVKALLCFEKARCVLQPSCLQRPDRRRVFAVSERWERTFSSSSSTPCKFGRFCPQLSAEPCGTSCINLCHQRFLGTFCSSKPNATCVEDIYATQTSPFPCPCALALRATNFRNGNHNRLAWVVFAGTTASGNQVSRGAKPPERKVTFEPGPAELLFDPSMGTRSL